MELENEIREVLELEVFKHLSPEEKEVVFKSILANCLILSKGKRKDFLDVIRNCLVSIENLKDSSYSENNLCYAGIVKCKAGKALDEAQTIYPFQYELKYKEFTTPFGELTKSILHEFGHLAVKKDGFRLTDTTYFIPTGGTVITELLKNDYGMMLNEIINELTNFLSFKAFLSYRTPDPEQRKRMIEFAEKRGISVEESTEYLRVLPDDLFTSYTEDELSTTTLEEGTDKMFNPLYVKYTPLVRLMLFVFQNPAYTYEDLREEFEKGNGLEAKKDGLPINDLLYSYYESPLRIQDLFNSMMGNGAWQSFCREFDKKMLDKEVDDEFVQNTVELLTEFYHKRLYRMVKQGKITKQQLVDRAEELIRIKTSCLLYYDNVKERELA